MKLTTLALSLALALPGVAFAQEGKELAELVFESIDQAGRGYVDMGEFTNFGGDVFYSMDQDEDGKVTLDEFMAWSFGASVIAEEEGPARSPMKPRCASSSRSGTAMATAS